MRDARASRPFAPILRPLARRWRRLPTRAKMPVRRVLYAPLELADRLLGRRDPHVPPRWLRYVGPGDFRAIGEEFAGLLVTLAGLRPDHRVLDIGCGAGRMAVPLARLLGPQGRYDGIDVVPAAIRWCRRHVAPLHPGFRFHLADLRNARYNPGGGTDAASYRFPFADSAFDTILLASVLTHLAPEAVARYLDEVARLLAPGGCCLASVFVLDDLARERIAAGATAERFVHVADGDRWRTVRPGDPEDVVALDEAWLRERIAASGLVLVGPIHRGRWAGRADGVSHQDLVVVTPRARD